MEQKEVMKYWKEVLLQVFGIITKKLKDLKEIGDLSGIEKLEREVIPLYEKFYTGLEEFSDKTSTYEREQFDRIKVNIDNIAKAYSLEKEYILDQMKLREKNKDNSGSDVVKNLFEYERKKLLNIKGDFTREINQLLDKEEKLNIELSDAIQEVDQLEIIDKLLPVREKYRESTEKYLEVYKKIEELENKINKKWYYEIYGTMSKEEMLEIYKNEV
ncbi:hypothetical protein [Fusobacterium sp. PH5-44]|uniref:hypothetical protein n=1 Tax=unclassified Fusobacterium TaxID=2648384 RepID=UPI003D248174